MRVATRKHRIRSGLSRIDVIVVLVVIAMLIMLALPGNVGSRQAARKLECLNYLKNLGLAASNYAAGDKGNLPLLTTSAELFAGGTIHPTNVAWTVALLPYLDNAALARNFEPVSGTLRLKVFTCPSDQNNFGQPGGLSYVANAGYGAFTYDPKTGAVTEDTLVLDGKTYGHSPDALLIDWDGDGSTGRPGEPDPEDQEIQRASGAFWRPAADGFRMTQDYISVHDGMGQTILFAESLNAGSDGNWASPNLMNMAFVFGGHPAPRVGPRLKAGLKPLEMGTSSSEYGFVLGETVGGEQIPVYAPNRSKGEHRGRLPAPSSRDPGSVNVAFAGGNSKSIADNIDPTIWARLMTPDGERFGQVRIGDGDY